MEEVSPGTESVRLAQSFGRLRYSVALDQQNQSLQLPSIASPGASTTSLTPSTTKKTRRASSLFKRQSSAPVDPDTTSKPFDTILHFLPADEPDKARLKAAILVTTLTRPYLASPPSRAPTTRFYSDMSTNTKPSASTSGTGKRWSLFRGLSTSAASSSTTLNAPSPSPSRQSPNPLSRSTTDLSDESTRTTVAHSNSATLARLRKSRLIHVTPSAPPRSSSSRFPSYSSSSSQQQQHVIRSIEAFLLSFAFLLPSARELPAPIAGFVGCDAESARARPYVLPAGSLREILQFEGDRSENEGHEDEKEKGEWTLAELILCGALESESETPRPRHSHLNSGFSLAEGARRISDETRKGKERQVDNSSRNNDDKDDENGWMARRAWISGVRDIVVMRSSKTKTKTSANEVEKQGVEQPQNRVQSPVREKERSHSPSQTQAQAQVQALAARNLNLNSASNSPSNSPSKSNSESYAFVYPKKEQGRRESSNVKPPLAIEKRLPTPPQESESVQEDTTSRSAARSQKRQSVPLERRERERERESGLRSSEKRLQPRSRDSVPVQPSSTSRVHHQPESRPHVSIPTTSSTYHQHHSSHHSRTHSPRHHHDYENQLRYERSPRSPSHGHNGNDCEEQVSATSLPTPPDSEEASFENERTPTSHASPSKRYERERRDRDWERDGDRDYEDMDEVEERNRRRRTRSHPSQPHRPSDFDERTPPRRAKTRPMEKSRDRTPMPAPVRPEYLRSASSEERRARRVPVPTLTETATGTVRMTPKPHPPSSQARSSVSKPTYPMPMQVAPPARLMEKSKSERVGKWKFWKGVPAA